MSKQSHTPGPKTDHPFERTLGPGPYRFAGTFDLGQVLAALNAGNIAGYNAGLASMPDLEAGGGTCAHCGMPITFICIVQTGSGKRYGVGSDCILKAGMPAKELSQLERAKRAHQKKLREARKAKKGAEARAEVRRLMKERAPDLLRLDHPTRLGATLYDYASWTAQFSSDGGIVFALARIKHELDGGES